MNTSQKRLSEQMLELIDITNKMRARRNKRLRAMDVGAPSEAPYRTRTVYPRPDYWSSEWGRELRTRRWENPADKKGGKRFRRRFRVPYPVFQEIVNICRRESWFTEGNDACGHPCAPLELKILGVLRVLGRGYCFDGIEELTYISDETMRVFFHDFCEVFSKSLYSRFCNPPSTAEEIEEV
jgi:hypothetical protein